MSPVVNLLAGDGTVTALDKTDGQHGLVALVGAPGPQGPPGPPGGGGAARHVHNQSSAATTWTVNHNLGYSPVVSVLTPGGVEQLAEVVHVSFNQCLIYFASPASGQAIAV